MVNRLPKVASRKRSVAGSASYGTALVAGVKVVHIAEQEPDSEAQLPVCVADLVQDLWPH